MSSSIIARYQPHQSASSTGEYVAAEKIEAAYKKNNLVEQIWVYGNSLESTLVAIVVPTGVNIPCLPALCLPCLLLCLRHLNGLLAWFKDFRSVGLISGSCCCMTTSTDVIPSTVVMAHKG